eukprot:15388626-Heterocapsa_arctica.AAC.1
MLPPRPEVDVGRGARRQDRRERRQLGVSHYLVVVRSIAHDDVVSAAPQQEFGDRKQLDLAVGCL